VSGAYESARDHAGPLELSCDVVVVGSGAGGAVVAAELAESGLEVVVLEEGPRVTAEEHGRMRPTESVRQVWRSGSLTVALGLGDTPSVNVMMGCCVGGSSIVTGGVCFRIPDPVLAEWSGNLGLEGYTPQAMEPVFNHVERRTHVEVVPERLRSRSTVLFAEGAKKLGYELEPMSRNTDGCRGCGSCNFGCPHSAKRSVDLSYLPSAVEHGAQVWSHCRVDRVLFSGRRAVGVEGRLLNRAGGKPGDGLVVRSKAVVVAAGAWHSPLVLASSGLGFRQHVLGKNMTLHPGFRVAARFDEPVRGWRGALQSAWSGAFEHEGITLTSVFIPVGALASVLPGIGREHGTRCSSIDHIAIFGGIIHDEGGGRVRRGLGREPIVTYRMSRRDRSRVPRIMRVMAETFRAAGARELYMPVIGMDPVSPDALDSAPLEQIHGRHIECTSQHPLGTCQMGRDPGCSVVDGEGRVWDTEGLFVADGSVLPTSLGVNPQLSIMSVATRIAWGIRDRGLRER
jgi:choline dehydrogenase-like flavoprotein